VIGFDAILLSSPAAGSVAGETRRLLRDLDARLAAIGRRREDLLGLTFFVDAENGRRASPEELAPVLDAHFGSRAPPASVVHQAPAGPGRVALEATVASGPDTIVDRRTCDGTVYSLARRGRVRQLHCHGIACDARDGDTEAQATAAFAAMRAVLERERMSFGHVVRQWGYIERLLDLRPDCPLGHQRYQAFNDVRSLFYASSAFPNGYPAATGIGQAAGGVVLEFIALDAPGDVRIAPVSNPRQTDAHRYSNVTLVGASLARLADKTTPKFERAKKITTRDGEVVLVSGTASIVGEKSVGLGDVEAQTRTTIENILALVGDAGLSRLRAYVRRRGDLAAVRRICEEAFGPIPALYVEADVCRDDLLVELEGMAGARAPVATRGT